SGGGTAVFALCAFGSGSVFFCQVENSDTKLVGFGRLPGWKRIFSDSERRFAKGSDKGAGTAGQERMDVQDSGERRSRGRLADVSCESAKGNERSKISEILSADSIGGNHDQSGGPCLSR